MKPIKCKYCGKIYDSPSEMHKRKCHSHPDGAWAGYCTAGNVDEFTWSMEKHFEDQKKTLNELKQIREEEAAEEADFSRMYKKHTPLLDCVLEKGADGGPREYKLKIQNSDIHQFAREMANGLNTGKETRDAINTIYALRSGCDYVLNNADAQKEGSLGSWLAEIRQLKGEVISWDFWAALYWLTKPIEDAKAKDDEGYAKSIREGDYDAKMAYGKKVSFWISNSVAKVFHVKRVIPMLRVLGVLKKDDDGKDNVVMEKFRAHISNLKATEKGFGRIFEMLDRRIGDGSFWGVLYCLYWMQLRPTPWDDQKVWPIR